MSLIYLAIPYSVWDTEKSFDVANKVAADLMQQGHTVFSPISHSHPIQKELPESCWNHDFWMNQDLPILRLCDKLYVVVIRSYNGVKVDGGALLKKSRGCNQEIDLFIELNKPITYYTYGS